MTRINVSIPVKNLTDEHLLAEHREIKRLPFNFKIRNYKNNFKGIPNKFTLGTGHVLFFINKPQYTYKRYIEIHEECLRRKFKIKNYKDNWKIYDKFWENTWIPEKSDYEVIIDRVCDRITETKKVLHYCGKQITKEYAIEILRD